IVPEDTAYDGNLLQVQGQEIMPDSFPARSKGTFGNLIVRQFAPPAVEGTQALNIRYGFQVKDQRGRHYRWGRYLAGSSGVPPRRISKCRRGDGASLWPSSAICSPRRTF